MIVSTAAPATAVTTTVAVVTSCVGSVGLPSSMACLPGSVHERLDRSLQGRQALGHFLANRQADTESGLRLLVHHRNHLVGLDVAPERCNRVLCLDGRGPAR